MIARIRVIFMKFMSLFFTIKEPVKIQIKKIRSENYIRYIYD